MTRGMVRGVRFRLTLACGAVCLAFTGWGLPPAASQEVKTVAASSLDRPIELMLEARKAYAGVRDYTCTLVKRESLPTNPDDNIIALKFRGAPYSVYMRWIGPHKFKGQEVAYFHGKNRNQLRVHAKGLLKGIAGFVSVDVNDARVRECTRHNIYAAGIGYLIEKTLQHWDAERKLNKTEVKMGEYAFNGKRCHRIETIQSERRPEYYCYRTVIYIDQESKLPIRAENYDWPRAGGAPEGDLIEMFSYVDLRTNVGLTDRDFDK